MELDLGPDIAAFRAEQRDWIASEAPAGLAALIDWNTTTTAGGQRGAQLIAAQAHPAYAEWEAKLAARRLMDGGPWRPPPEPGGHEPKAAGGHEPATGGEATPAVARTAP